MGGVSCGRGGRRRVGSCARCGAGCRARAARRSRRRPRRWCTRSSISVRNAAPRTPPASPSRSTSTRSSSSSWPASTRSICSWYSEPTPAIPASVVSMCDGKTATPRTFTMSSVRPVSRAIRGNGLPHAHGSTMTRRQVAGPVPQQRRRLLPQGREHELALVAIGDGLERVGVDDLDDEVVGPVVDAVVRRALDPDTRPVELRHPVDVERLDAERLLDAPAHRVTPALRPEDPDPQRELVAHAV